MGRSNVVLGSGARAFGMGGAFLARADDATAASWNPAGLSYLRRPEISLVWAGTGFDTQKRDPGLSGASSDDRLRGQGPSFFSLAHPLDFKSLTGAAQISYQRVISFDGKRTIQRGEQIQIEGDGGFDVLTIGAGVKLPHQLRLGVAFNRWFHGYSQARESQASHTRSQTARFDMSGFNLNLGLIWSLWPSLNLGLVGKTPFTGNVVLHRERSDIYAVGNGSQETTQNAFTSDDVRLQFPGAVGAGASWRPRSALTLSLDYTRTAWSSAFVHDYFTLPATLPGLPAPVPSAPTDLFLTLPYPTLLGSAQADAVQVRAGIEYVVTHDRVRWPLRVGWFDDQQFFRAQNGRPVHLNGASVGTGLLLRHLILDVAYTFESGQYIDAAGLTNSVSARAIFVSLIYRHGGHDGLAGAGK